MNGKKNSEIRPKIKELIVTVKNLSLSDIADLQKKVALDFQKDNKSESASRITRSRARSIGLDINVKFAEALQNKPLKRKIKHDDRKEEAKKPKVAAKDESDKIKPRAKSQSTQKVKQAVECELEQQKSPTTIEAQEVTNDTPMACSSNAVARIDFKINEVVWAKIRGSPHWPAKIKHFSSSKMVVVVWFNDHRTTKIYKTQMFKFLPNFDLYAQNFSSTVGLERAAKEGLICYGQNIGKL